MRVDNNPLSCKMPLEDWLALNRNQCFDDKRLMTEVAPFPPSELMVNVSGLDDERDFASHGCDIYEALSYASAISLAEYERILDFGCGCGRLARLFKGHPHEVHSCDIDYQHVQWMQENLSYMQVLQTDVHPPSTYAGGMFNAIISISIFTHINESSQDEFLVELHRISAPGSRLFLTVHGEVALRRAKNDPATRAMLDVDDTLFGQAEKQFFKNKYGFILQQGHLTVNTSWSHKLKKLFGWDVVDQPFEYGISFVSEKYIYKHWSRWFDIIAIHPGAIHDFQDIVVLTPKK